MGTTAPLIHIEAATHPGGIRNQDRYAYNSSWAFVLDGATSSEIPQSDHDGGWYAERLRNALLTRLRDHPTLPIGDLVADAISDAASAHHSHDGPCPTSTISLARWTADQIELYVLGDSYAIVTTSAGSTLTTDDRLTTVASELRAQCHQRLTEGHGFDSAHQVLLRELRQRETLHRNQENGYWIAGDNPGAAHHAIKQTFPIQSIRSLILATDGVLDTEQGLWPQYPQMTPTQIIYQAIRLEEDDPQARRHPRSKRHDDKTIIKVTYE